MIYLVRHGSHWLLDRVLCGRTHDVPLSPQGMRQTHALARQFAGIEIDLVQSSPRQRCRQTAAPIAQAHGLAVECANDMDELDPGDWSGRSFENLACDPAWRRWNACRGSARPPGGESMAALQTRVVAHIERLLSKHAQAVIVTHAEPIRAALLHYRGMPLDRYQEIDVPPASVSILRASGAGATRISTVSVPS
jgi:probable phosphoglycerate mutase